MKRLYRAISRRAWKAAYKRYLQSPQWKKKRKLVIIRDRYKCQLCGSKKKLQVHHKTYAHVFNEPLTDLITLCQKCHSAVHRKSPKRKRRRKKKDGRVKTTRRMVNRKRT